MGTDRARRSFDPGRMYRSVVAQQGRVTLEADGNEADEIRAEDARAALIDVIGPTGSPDHGFEITVPLDLDAYDFAIGAGTLYVGGVRLELAATEAPATYLGQQHAEWVDYPAGAPADYPATAIRELVYLAVTEQEVVAIEDPALREVALGGPDTAGRTRMIARVHRAPVAADACEGAFAELLPVIAGGARVPGQPDRRLVDATIARRPLMSERIERLERAPGLPWTTPRPMPAAAGLSAGGASLTAGLPATWDPATMVLTSPMTLKAGFVVPAGTADPCQPIAQSGFLGAENQLVRVQVAAGGANLLWAFDNASALYRMQFDPAKPRQLVLGAAPVDVFHQPRVGQRAELLVTAVDLGGDARMAAATGPRVRIAGYERDQRIVLLDADLPAEITGAGSPQVFVRIWENEQPFAANDTTGVELATDAHVSTGVWVWTRGTVRVPGDHWLIGVRPTVPDKIFPARLQADFQPPDGPRRWVTPLAVVSWKDAHHASLSDCRRPFRPLTEDDDLEFHNQHLHGWGVVCGLQVNCLPLASGGTVERPHEHVLVRDGYAIHPTGKDIRLRTAAGATTLAIGDLAFADTSIGRRADGTLENGTISLWIEKDRTFHTERYVAPEDLPWTQRFKGSLLVDIYNDCVFKILAFLKTRFVPGTNDGPVGPANRRLIAAINLLYQLARPEAVGVYLSGAPGPQAETEDSLLRELFDGLKGLLQSKTFCALFDDVAYPDYDVYRDGLDPNTPRPTTIFGTGGHTRLRVDTQRKRAFTCGADGNVNVYDLDTHQFAQVVPFPVAAANVQDVAFSPTGNEVYAIAWVGAGLTDSAFVRGSVDTDGVFRWSADPALELPGVRLITLATADGKLYAAGRGHGLYEIRLGAAAPFEQIEQFSATGHLVVGSFPNDVAVLYAGAREGEAEPVAFSHVYGFAYRLKKRVYLRVPQASNDGAGLARDDLAAIPSGEGFDHVYAIADDVDEKRLLIWNPTTDTAFLPFGATVLRSVGLGVSAASRIAYSKRGGWALITDYDSFVGRVYRPGQLQLDPEVHPLQLGPIAIDLDTEGDRFCVLELISNTITVIPARPQTAEPWRSTIVPDRMENYRRLAIGAFMKMIGRLVQYLKDCVCEHLLIQCPTGDGRVYLADVSFKDGKVYQICNFGRRRYVHSFPTVEYWMSLLPVLPLLDEAIAKVCCTVITEFFDRLAPEVKDNHKAKSDTVPMALARAGIGYAATANLSRDVAAGKAQVTLAQKLLKVGAIEGLRTRIPPPRPPEVAVKVPETGPEAIAAAADHGLVVRRTEVARPGTALDLIRERPPSRGDTVDLVTDAGGRVLGWRRVTPEVAAAPPVAVPSPELGELRKQVAELSAQHAQQVAAMDQQLAKSREEIKSLRGQVDTQAAAIKKQERPAEMIADARRMLVDPRRLANLSPRGRELLKELVEIDAAFTDLHRPR